MPRTAALASVSGCARIRIHRAAVARVDTEAHRAGRRAFAMRYNDNPAFTCHNPPSNAGGILMTQQSAPSGPITPVGLNHLVLNVRDLEESHRFWTEILGFKQVGELKSTPQRPNPPKMRFYSGDHEGKMQHHD